MGGSFGEGQPDGSLTPVARALAAAAAFAAALPACATLPEPPRPPAGFKGATGSVVQFQESAATRILYREEKGAMILPVSPAIAGSAREALPPPGSTPAAPLRAPAAAPSGPARAAAPAKP